MKPKAIIVSGYFNPIHTGHLELFEKGKAAGDELWVIVNSDLQRQLKGSKEFMDENERLIIVSSIKHVDKSLISIDKDKTQCATLENLADEYGADFELYFANGGDQNNESIPEVSICREKGIGQLLVSELCKRANSLNAYRISLFCKKELITFYEKNGFKINNVVMKKWLV